MIRRKSEMEEKIVNNLRGGDGDVSMFHFMNEAESHGAGSLFARMVMKPGTSIGKHTHEGTMEAYYILKGRAVVDDCGSGEVTLEAGDCHICPEGSAHCIKNPGDEVMEFMAIILNAK